MHGDDLIQRSLRSVSYLTSAAFAVAVLGIACATAEEASPSETPAAAPPAAAAAVPTVAPAALAPPAAVAPAQAPASIFVMPTPRPTRTPIPRTVGDMTQPVLYGHTATLLEDGRVLVTGGQARVTGSLPPLPAAVVSAEIYDPATGHWSPTGQMFDPRRHHGAVLLEDGRVLVSGGMTDEFDLSPANAGVSWVGSIPSAEIYDPAIETWSLVGDMPEDKGRHTLIPMKDGNVLAIGGVGPSAALFDSASGSWAPGGESTIVRDWDRGILLPNGKVLVPGGSEPRWDVHHWDSADRFPVFATSSAELYDPLTGSWSTMNSMSEPRAIPSATVLGDGRVLVTGGFGNFGDSLDSAEIYDPSSGSWSGVGKMATTRVGHTATSLSDGRVLVVGGRSNQRPEIFDPPTSGWSKAARTIDDREGHTATLLDDGRVLVAGGASGTSGRQFPITSAEVYDPATGTWTPSTEAAR